MSELDPVVEQRLADMSAEEFAALTARVRPPTSSQQLKNIAGKVLSGDALNAFVSVANPKAFAGENGDVDESKVMGHLTAMFASHQGAQASGPTPAGKLGSAGKAEAARRFGTGAPAADQRPDDGWTGRAVSGGAAGRAEAAKRFGKGR
jgi:hypothetical protein